MNPAARRTLQVAQQQERGNNNNNETGVVPVDRAWREQRSLDEVEAGLFFGMADHQDDTKDQESSIRCFENGQQMV